LKEEAESQLNRYSLDEKFQKAIGGTPSKKLVLIFCRNRRIYHDEAPLRLHNLKGITQVYISPVFHSFSLVNLLKAAADAYNMNEHEMKSSTVTQRTKSDRILPDVERIND
jgi:hypothetical protein